MAERIIDFVIKAANKEINISQENFENDQVDVSGIKLFQSRPKMRQTYFCVTFIDHILSPTYVECTYTYKIFTVRASVNSKLESIGAKSKFELTTTGF